MTVCLPFSRTAQKRLEAREECITTWSWRSASRPSYLRVLHCMPFLVSTTSCLYGGLIHYLGFLAIFTGYLFGSAEAFIRVNYHTTLVVCITTLPGKHRSLPSSFGCFTTWIFCSVSLYSFLSESFTAQHYSKSFTMPPWRSPS